MLKIIFKFLKKVVFSFFTLYGFNLIVSALNVVIPINWFSIAMVTLLGIPGLCSVIGLFFLI